MTIKALAPELRAESFGALALSLSKACITGKPAGSLGVLTLPLPEPRPINDRDPLKPRPSILPPRLSPWQTLIGYLSRYHPRRPPALLPRKILTSQSARADRVPIFSLAKHTYTALPAHFPGQLGFLSGDNRGWD